MLTSLDAAVAATLARFDVERFSKRLWERDACLWKSEPEHERVIKNSLGWLTVPQSMLDRVGELLQFVQEVHDAGFKHAVVLGMGGSSLCPDVCRVTFGTAPAFLELHVLDSTLPASVARLEKSIQVAKTLFLVSSKSGGTAETLSFYKYFYDRVRSLKRENAGENFVAITDPGTSLEKLALEQRFRRVFHGQPDIGGRYSALSNFGMVPAALAGVEVRALLDRAVQMARACAPSVPARDNPGIVLGTVLGEAARAGRDKVTFVMSPGIYTFADWAEQLLAESTGKEGKGLLPVVREHLDEPAFYGDDRLFIHMRLSSEQNGKVEQRLKALEAAGHPVIRITLESKLDLGGEFFRWEVATAAAGAILGINPFDQPNVQESKDNTNGLLAQVRSQGRFEERVPIAETDSVKLYCDAVMRDTLAKSRRQRGLETNSPEEYFAAFLTLAEAGDFLALLAYLDPSSHHRAVLRAIRLRLRDALHVATTVGYGPRYLHSTGQLHKGGGNNGLFIQITADDAKDLSIPGEPYTFSVLKQAQALGDMQSLESKGRRVVRFHLVKSVSAGLDRLLETVKTAVAQARAKRTVLRSSRADHMSGDCDPPGNYESAVAEPGVRINPLREGMRLRRTPEPCAMVIFGASGDLTERKIVPALYYLARERLLPAGFSVIGCARTPYTHDQFREKMRQAVIEYLHLPADESEAFVDSFGKGIFYLSDNFGDPAAYDRLKALLDQLDHERGTCGNRLFYLATPPSFFPRIVNNLGVVALARPQVPGKSWTRIVIEKPFGRDVQSAQELNRTVASVFHEEEVYRIDHYLGKETVQNLLVFRFANGIFEPIWNRRYIDHIQITVAEDLGIENRGAYYEEAGLLRDMIQNHVLQLLSLVAMEPPATFQAAAVRDEKAKVLRSIRPIALERAHEFAVRGQYAEGFVRGHKVPAYRSEPKVAPTSVTETYGAVKLYIDNWRWADVPFYLRSGKRLPKRASEISIQFRRVPHLLFRDTSTEAIEPNLLAVHLQPNEGISLKFSAKLPGTVMHIRPVMMDFRYGESFGASPPTAYETLLLDCMLGDATLFNREDAVELSWELVEPILERWKRDGGKGLTFYEAGSWGPPDADAFIEGDGRRWQRL